MTSNLALQIQRLGGYSEQVLVMSHVAQLQNANRSASPSAIKQVFLAIHVPPPTNISEYLNRLAKNKLALRIGSGEWALTPEGLETIRNLMVGASADDLRSLTEMASDEVLFGEARHHLIPPEFAPANFQRGIAKFLQGHPFDNNVFCITRFPKVPEEPLAEAIEAAKGACAEAGLELHLASDRLVEDLLFGNVAAAMWACRYGIAIFENRLGDGLRHNVTIEVGGMLMTGRRCLLLRDPTIKEMPTDVVGHIYQPVDLGDTSAVRRVVLQWGGDVR